MALRGNAKVSIQASSLASDTKIRKKERILNALTKMNDRDTQRTASEELLCIVHDMDQEGLPIIINSICGTGPEQKVYARKECARALGIVATETCPVRDQALQQPYLTKMLNQLKKALQDPDSSVRDAASEAMALIARGCSEISGMPLGTLANPVLKALFDSLIEQKKELQTAACMALGMAAPYFGQLDAALVKEVIKKLNSTSFQAGHALLAAMAHCEPETNMPAGLMKSGPGAFLPVLTTLIGQPILPLPAAANPGSGVLACLSSKEWLVRRAAADWLKAVALLFGPLLELEGCWEPSDPHCMTARCSRALEGCKFDKVKEVRETARDALSMLDDLLEYGKGGGGTAGWSNFVNEKMKVKGLHPPLPAPMGPPGRPTSARRSRSPSPPHGRRPPSPPKPKQPGNANSRSSPAAHSDWFPSPAAGAAPHARSPLLERHTSPFARQGSLADRFKKAHGQDDVVTERGRQQRNGDEEGARRSPEASPELSFKGQFDNTSCDNGLDATLSPLHLGTYRGQVASSAPPSQPPGSSSSETVTVLLEDWQGLQQQLQDMEARHRELLDALAKLTETSSKTISELQERVRVLEIDAMVGSLAEGGLRSSTVTVQLPEPYDPQASEAQGLAGPHGADTSTPSKYGYDSPRASLALVRPMSPKTLKGTADIAPADLNSAYLEALTGDRGQLHLLRLMQRTGCVWGELHSDTALRLLSSFITYVQGVEPRHDSHWVLAAVQDGMMLPKILPWLWRLADEQQIRFPLPLELRMQLLQALSIVVSNTATEDVPTSEKVALLLQTLKSYWNINTEGTLTAATTPAASTAAQHSTPNHPKMSSQRLNPAPAPGTVAATATASPKPSHQSRPSLESLDALRGALDDMQRNFLNSPKLSKSQAER